MHCAHKYTHTHTTVLRDLLYPNPIFYRIPNHWPLWVQPYLYNSTFPLAQLDQSIHFWGAIEAGISLWCHDCVCFCMVTWLCHVKLRNCWRYVGRVGRKRQKKSIDSKKEEWTVNWGLQKSKNREQHEYFLDLSTGSGSFQRLRTTLASG